MEYKLGFNFKDYDFIFDKPIHNTKIIDNVSWMLTNLFDYLRCVFFLCIIAIIMIMIVTVIKYNGSSFM